MSDPSPPPTSNTELQRPHAHPVIASLSQFFGYTYETQKALFEAYLGSTGAPAKPPSTSPMPKAPAGMVPYATVADGRCFWRSVGAALTAAERLDVSPTSFDCLRVGLALFFTENYVTYEEDFEAHYVPLVAPKTKGLGAREAAITRSCAPLRFNGTQFAFNAEGCKSRAVQYAFALVKGLWGGDFEARLIADCYYANVTVRTAAGPSGVSDVVFRPRNTRSGWRPIDIYLGRSSEHYCVYLPKDTPARVLPEGVAPLQQQVEVAPARAGDRRAPERTAAGAAAGAAAGVAAGAVAGAVTAPMRSSAPAGAVTPASLPAVTQPPRRDGGLPVGAVPQTGSCPASPTARPPARDAGRAKPSNADMAARGIVIPRETAAADMPAPASAFSAAAPAVAAATQARAETARMSGVPPPPSCVGSGAASTADQPKRAPASAEQSDVSWASKMAALNAFLAAKSATGAAEPDDSPPQKTPSPADGPGQGRTRLRFVTGACGHSNRTQRHEDEFCTPAGELYPHLYSVVQQIPSLPRPAHSFCV